MAVEADVKQRIKNRVFVLFINQIVKAERYIKKHGTAPQAGHYIIQDFVDSVVGLFPEPKRDKKGRFTK